MMGSDDSVYDSESVIVIHKYYLAQQAAMIVTETWQFLRFETIDNGT